MTSCISHLHATGAHQSGLVTTEIKSAPTIMRYEDGRISCSLPSYLFMHNNKIINFTALCIASPNNYIELLVHGLQPVMEIEFAKISKCINNN